MNKQERIDELNGDIDLAKNNLEKTLDEREKLIEDVDFWKDIIKNTDLDNVKRVDDFDEYKLDGENYLKALWELRDNYDNEFGYECEINECEDDIEGLENE